MDSTARFDGVAVRGALLKHGGPDEAGFIRYAYRPFDTRWLYWEMDGGLLDRPRPDYKPHVFDGNLWLVLQNKARPHLSPPSLISDIGDLNQMNSGVYCIPALLREEGLGINEGELKSRPNLSIAAQTYLDALGKSETDLFYHVLAVLHRPAHSPLQGEFSGASSRARLPAIPRAYRCHHGIPRWRWAFLGALTKHLVAGG